MTCLDFENRVQELLDRRQTELPDELAAHAACCATCQELWGHFQHLQNAIEAWRVSSSTVALAEAVLLRLSVESKTAAGSQIVTTRPVCTPSTGFAVLLASAAALLIALGIGWRVSSNAALANRQLSSTTMLVANRTETVTPAITTTDRHLDVLLHDARDAYVALASLAWQDVSTANVLLPPADDSTPFKFDAPAANVPETLSLPLTPYGRELRDAVDSWLLQVFQNQDSST